MFQVGDIVEVVQDYTHYACQLRMGEQYRVVELRDETRIYIIHEHGRVFYPNDHFSLVRRANTQEISIDDDDDWDLPVVRPSVLNISEFLDHPANSNRSDDMALKFKPNDVVKHRNAKLIARIVEFNTERKIYKIEWLYHLAASLSKGKLVPVASSNIYIPAKDLDKYEPGSLQEAVLLSQFG